MLWGAGTALGEVPPYAFSYHAAKAGKQNEDLEKMFGMRSSGSQHGLLGGIVVRMKNWMLQFIKRYADLYAHTAEAASRICRYLNGCSDS